jgi:integrase/recombinase XerC
VPKPYKLQSTRRLPADAEILDHEGKPHVRIKLRGKPTLCRLTKDGTKYLRPSKCWYFDIPGRTPPRVKGFTDLKATEQYAWELERKAARKKVGLIDPAEEHIRRPLTDHLKDYAAHLTAKGDVPLHVRNVVAKITALCSGCKFVFPLDTDAAKAVDWLNTLRRDADLVAIPADDSFKPAVVAELLGVTVAAVGSAVKRLGLAASGNGKARRLPRATVEALVLRKAKGRGPETANHYVRTVRAFFNWLVEAKRMLSNPLETLTLQNAAVDVRRARRELTADELRRLFTAARSSKRTFRGLTGTDRFYLYLTAAGTGFRANALANLTPADFDLDVGGPIVTLAARFNKSRKPKEQPIPTDVADALREHLSGKPLNAPVWGGKWGKDRLGAEMLRGDLVEADIPYATEGPDGPEYADFHSLRHSYLTLGGRSGIDLRTLQILAGHSTPVLTARYSHRRLHDLVVAVDKLPNLVPSSPGTDASAIPLRSTGTDGAGGVVPGVVTGRISPRHTASSCTFEVIGGTRDEVAEAREMQAKTPICTVLHQYSSERAMGFEPTTASLEG